MMAYTKVADLSVDELRSLIREVVTETFAELLYDPDEGLELREEIKSRLAESVTAVASGVKTRSAAEVAAKLGLEW